MTKVFVPSNELSSARVALIQFRLKNSLDSHIARFQELDDICHTPKSKAFTCLQLSLPTPIQYELAKAYPQGSPTSMEEVYNFVHNLHIADKLKSGDRSWSARKLTPSQSSAPQRIQAVRPSEATQETLLDPSLVQNIPQPSRGAQPTSETSSKTEPTEHMRGA
ncbi:unnamed protein product [Agarophyton chilense]